LFNLFNFKIPILNFTLEILYIKKFKFTKLIFRFLNKEKLIFRNLLTELKLLLNLLITNNELVFDFSYFYEFEKTSNIEKIKKK